MVLGSRDEGGVCTPPLFVICHGGTGWVVASRWGAAPAELPLDGGWRRRMADATDGPRRTRKPPASLPGTLGDGPTGQTPPGNPPPDSGALCVRPLPSGRRRRRSASGGDTAQRVRVVCRFEKVTYRCSPRIESFSARQLSATRSCTCWQISTRCSRAASSSSPRRSCLGRAICL